jgi:hypothetical protein
MMPSLFDTCNGTRLRLVAAIASRISIAVLAHLIRDHKKAPDDSGAFAWRMADA